MKLGCVARAGSRGIWNPAIGPLDTIARWGSSRQVSWHSASRTRRSRNRPNTIRRLRSWTRLGLDSPSNGAEIQPRTGTMGFEPKEDGPGCGLTGVRPFRTSTSRIRIPSPFVPDASLSLGGGTGTMGFSPEEDGRPRFARPLRLPGFESPVPSLLASLADDGHDGVRLSRMTRS